MGFGYDWKRPCEEYRDKWGGRIEVALYNSEYIEYVTHIGVTVRESYYLFRQREYTPVYQKSKTNVRVRGKAWGRKGQASAKTIREYKNQGRNFYERYDVDRPRGRRRVIDMAQGV